MSSLLYDLLALAGYSHPVHPVLVHVPAGMTIGAFCFAILATVTKRQVYRTTAYQIIVLTLIFTVLAIPVGIMDWQRFYGGAWFFEIEMKLVLAALYVILTTITVIVGRRLNDSPVMPMLYLSSMLTVMGLGFFGGQLVYHGFAPEMPKDLKAGHHLFESHCSGCHRRGENIIVPNLPLRTAVQLNNFDDFLGFIRDPKMPDGSPGPMPRFALDKISDEQARQLYDYLCFAFLSQNSPLR